MPGFSPTGCLQKAQTGVLHRFHILVFLVAAFLLFLPSESVGKRNKTNSASRKSQKTSCQKFLRGINLPDNPRKTWKSIRSCTMMIAISKKNELAVQHIKQSWWRLWLKVAYFWQHKLISHPKQNRCGREMAWNVGVRRNNEFVVSNPQKISISWWSLSQLALNMQSIWEPTSPGYPRIPQTGMVQQKSLVFGFNSPILQSVRIIIPFYGHMYLVCIYDIIYIYIYNIISYLL